MTWQQQAQQLFPALQSGSTKVGEIADEAQHGLAVIDQKYPISNMDSTNLKSRENALLELHYGLSSPLCRLTLDEANEYLEKCHPLINPNTGSLRSGVAETIRQIQSPQSRLAFVWNYWPQVVKISVLSTREFVRSTQGGRELWRAASGVTRRLAEIELSQGTKQTHFASVAKDLAFQMTSGGTTKRKFSELNQRLYVGHGLDIDQQYLGVVNSQSRFLEEAASVDGLHLEMGMRLWTGCIKECYFPEVSPLSPHFALLGAMYKGDQKQFRRSHSATAWFDTNRWGLYGSEPMPWPDIDPQTATDPSRVGTDFEFIPIGRFAAFSGRGCPAHLFMTLRLLDTMINPVLDTPEINGYALSYWSRFVKESGMPLRAVKSPDEHPQALSGARAAPRTIARGFEISKAL